jgi:preprotein translocase subunit SecD
MIMNSEGAQKWRAVTAEAAAATNKKAIAIVLDDNVYSAPTFKTKFLVVYHQLKVALPRKIQGIWPTY